MLWWVWCIDSGTIGVFATLEKAEEVFERTKQERIAHSQAVGEIFEEERIVLAEIIKQYTPV